MMNAPATGDTRAKLEEQLGEALQDEEKTNMAGMILGLMESAKYGSAKAFDSLAKLIDDEENKKKGKEKYCINPTDLTSDFVELYRTIHDTFDNKGKVREVIVKGGRGSIKSSFISCIAEETIYNDPEAHIVFTRRFKTDLKNSVYSQFVKTITRHDRLSDWTFTTNPLEATYKKTGQKVLFVGADKPVSLKSYNLPFGYVKMLIHEECDEMAGVEQMDNIEDTFLRADTPAIDVKIFNPPKSVNNFMNQYTSEKEGDPTTFVCHSYYYNVPVRWLGQRFFDRAEHFRVTKPKYYANNYLGEVTGVGGSIFDNVEVRTISDEEISTMPYFCHGLDFGYEHPQTFIKSYYDREKDILYCLEEVYSKKCKNSTFAKKISNYKNVEIICDSARPDNIAEMKDWGFDVTPAKKRWGNNLGRDYCWEWLQQCEKIVVDRERCPHLTQELTTLEFEVTKDGSFSSEYPKLGEDCVMALIYGLNREIMNGRSSDVEYEE